MTAPPDERRPKLAAHLTDRARAEEAARRARQAASLRENLRKRKEQARARAEAPMTGYETGEPETTG
jgi:hypothetical protein